MNKNAKKWVRALRSGQYEQGEGTLCREGTEEENFDRFCCLGVACDLYQREKGDLYIKNGYYKLKTLSYNDTIDFLPMVVQEWLELKTNEGNYRGTDLSIQNDKGKTFDQIANVIEKNQKALFV